MRLLQAVFSAIRMLVTFWALILVIVAGFLVLFAPFYLLIWLVWK
jgi:hypothetical protein